MNALFRAAIVFCVGLGSPALAQNTEIASIRHNGWFLASYRAQNTGQFSHCAANVSYNSGITLFFSINNRTVWNIAFSNRAWNLNKGDTINLQYYVDNGRPNAGTANVSGPDFVVLTLPDNAQLFQQMRAGQILYVNAAGQSFQFRLDGSSVVLQALLRCASSGGADLTAQAQAPQRAPAPPPVAEARPAPSPAPPAVVPRATTADQRLEATQFAANLLAESGMRGVRLLTSSELRSSGLPPFFQSSDVVWRADGVIGSLRVLSRRQETNLDAMAAELIADDARSCRGEFVTGRTADPDLPDIRRVQTYCSNAGGQPASFAYVLLPLPGGLIYQLSTVGRSATGQPDRESTAIQDNRLRDAVRAVVFRDSAVPPPVPPTPPSVPQGGAGRGNT